MSVDYFASLARTYEILKKDAGGFTIDDLNQEILDLRAVVLSGAHKVTTEIIDKHIKKLADYIEKIYPSFNDYYGREVILGADVVSTNLVSKYIFERMEEGLCSTIILSSAVFAEGVNDWYLVKSVNQNNVGFGFTRYVITARAEASETIFRAKLLEELLKEGPFDTGYDISQETSQLYAALVPMALDAAASKLFVAAFDHNHCELSYIEAYDAYVKFKQSLNTIQNISIFERAALAGFNNYALNDRNSEILIDLVAKVTALQL